MESAESSLSSPCPPRLIIKSLSSAPVYTPLKSVTGGLNVVSVLFFYFLFIHFFFISVKNNINDQNYSVYAERGGSYRPLNCCNSGRVETKDKVDVEIRHCDTGTIFFFRLSANRFKSVSSDRVELHDEILSLH